MFRAVAGVFCGIVQNLELFFAQSFVRVFKPLEIERAVKQFVFCKLRIARNFRILFLVAGIAVVHVRHKVIRAALESLIPEIRFKHIEPLGDVHSHFNESLLRYILSFQRLGKILSRFSGLGAAGFQHIAQILPSRVRILFISSG